MTAPYPSNTPTKTRERPDEKPSGNNGKLQAISHNVPEEPPEPFSSRSYTGYVLPPLKPDPAIVPLQKPNYLSLKVVEKVVEATYIAVIAGILAVYCFDIIISELLFYVLAAVGVFHLGVFIYVLQLAVYEYKSQRRKKRKRKLTSYQVHQHGADWMRDHDKQLGILPRDKPLDTSWRNMSKKEKARLECAKREYRIPMDFSSSSKR